MKTKKISSDRKNVNGSAQAGKEVSINKKISVTEIKSSPTEEEIKELAEILYQQRIDRGEDGTPEGDWLEAEEYLRYCNDK